mmetsp:Transcript_25638/g.69573  ORF Transcript_25638/g.69573 Transcript_25638/m.69573 type:complete len:456 (-) Transcript_25638:90-1457(-)
MALGRPPLPPPCLLMLPPKLLRSRKSWAMPLGMASCMHACMPTSGSQSRCCITSWRARSTQSCRPWTRPCGHGALQLSMAPSHGPAWQLGQQTSPAKRAQLPLRMLRAWCQNRHKRLRNEARCIVVWRASSAEWMRKHAALHVLWQGTCNGSMMTSMMILLMTCCALVLMVWLMWKAMKSSNQHPECSSQQKVWEATRTSQTTPSGGLPLAWAGMPQGQGLHRRKEGGCPQEQQQLLLLHCGPGNSSNSSSRAKMRMGRPPQTLLGGAAEVERVHKHVASCGCWTVVSTTTPSQGHKRLAARQRRAKCCRPGGRRQRKSMAWVPVATSLGLHPCGRCPRRSSSSSLMMSRSKKWVGVQRVAAACRSKEVAEVVEGGRVAEGEALTMHVKKPIKLQWRITTGRTGRLRRWECSRLKLRIFVLFPGCRGIIFSYRALKFWSTTSFSLDRSFFSCSTC